MRRSDEKSRRSGSAASGKKEVMKDLTVENNQRLAKLAEEIGHIKVNAASSERMKQALIFLIKDCG